MRILKKVVLLIATLVAVLALTGCTEKSTLTCTIEGETFEYVYDDNKLLEYHYNGELIEDGSIEDGMTMDYDAFVSIAGGIENYIENTQTFFETYGGVCEID